MIQFFLRSQYTAKTMKTDGRILGFRRISGYLRNFNPDYLETKSDKNLDLTPLESPCDFEQDRPIPDFKSLFADSFPKTIEKRKYFERFESEVGDRLLKM